jgi:hypothetical protein
MVVYPEWQGSKCVAWLNGYYLQRADSIRFFVDIMGHVFNWSMAWCMADTIFLRCYQ